MDKEKNKIVQSLYLCSTNSREKMQQSLIENILYSIGEPLSEIELLDLIKTEFHIEVDKFEIKEVICQMVSENILTESAGKFDLVEESKQDILRNVVENNEIESNRKNNITEQLKTINPELIENELKTIADTFNEYIYECFLEHGRNAIKFFMPFNNDFNINGNLLKEKIAALNKPTLQKAFSSLVSSYTHSLTKSDLDYLENLAIKAEYFFSLGIPEEKFNKAQDFKLNGLVLLVDTNFIYSILGLHSHRQNDNCNQITTLISNKKIDCKLVFIRKTLQELQNAKYDFERHITKETLTYNQIKCLLDSDTLNNFSKDYFEKKLVDPETPHPAEKIQHSQKILTSRKIQAYNYKFPHLEEEAYINAKFEDYYDYLNIKNEARAKHGLPELQQKHDKKLEHDIYLREAVISLRKDKNKINDLNYICLTLDKGLIEFDRFANGRYSKGQEDIAPNFILPSIFLRKIRPFIPMVTDDYKLAFITSITSNTIDTSLPQYSDAVQRSITYFKKLGIDDYDLIISIIKQELFFKEFIESEKEDKQEEFIRSEIDKAYEQLKIEKENANQELVQAEQRRIKELAKEEEKVSALKENMDNITSAYERENAMLSGEVNQAKKETEAVEYSKSKEHIALKENLYREKESTISDLFKQKLPIEKQGEKASNNYSLTFFLFVFAYFIILIILTIQIGWEIMGPVTYFLGFLGLIGTYLYPAISGKNINPNKHFEQKKSDFIKAKYLEFNFDINRFNKLIEEKEMLKIEIDELKTAHNNTRYKKLPGQ
jgi:hypothetical protein